MCVDTFRGERGTMKDLLIEKEVKGKVQVMKLSGSLDLHSFAKLERQVKTLFQEGHYRIVLDCNGLNYVSSAGLGSLVGFAKEAREHDGDVRLLNLPENVHKVMELLGFTKVLQIFNNANLAITSFTKLPTQP